MMNYFVVLLISVVVIMTRIVRIPPVLPSSEESGMKITNEKKGRQIDSAFSRT